MADSVSNVQGRILMEMNYILAYGSAEASLRLLWKFGLLETLLPIQVNGIRVICVSLLRLIINVFVYPTFISQAAYLARSGFRRRDKRTNMLLVRKKASLR